jgi:hypothetical protein
MRAGLAYPNKTVTKPYFYLRLRRAGNPKLLLGARPKLRITLSTGGTYGGDARMPCGMVLLVLWSSFWFNFFAHESRVCRLDSRLRSRMFTCSELIQILQYKF